MREIEKYALNDEQAILAKIRYNRLLDTFLGLTCYSLQNHLRTSVADIGEVEADEIYVGVDKRGGHYIIPVQAKRGSDRLSIVQIYQVAALYVEEFPECLCRPVAAIRTDEDTVAMLLFEQYGKDFHVTVERHYRLVP